MREPTERQRRRTTQSATIRDVAARAGVSPMTVSRVINRETTVKEETRALVEQAITDLNYAPNHAARSLAGSAPFRIGLLYDNPSTGYLSEFLVGALDESSRTGAQVVIEKCAEPELAGATLTRLLRTGVDGLILPPPLCESPQVLAEVKASGAAAVGVAPGMTSPDMATIRIDNEAAAYELTQHLLAFARRQPLRPEVHGIDRLIAESEGLLRRALGDAYGFHLRLGGGLRNALVDSSQFEAALLNLVVNARDATPAGGEVTIETRPVTLTKAVGDLGPGQYLRIAVRDTGVGMDTETAARAIEPFFTTKPPGEGTGLGLSQVYGFARQSGGSVDIETRPGQGATVAMLLPIAEARDLGASEAEIDHVAGQVPSRVLLVEDDPQVAELVDAMLHDLGQGPLFILNLVINAIVNHRIHWILIGFFIGLIRNLIHGSYF